MTDWNLSMKDGTTRTVRAECSNLVLGKREKRHRVFRRFWNRDGKGQWVVTEDVPAEDIQIVTVDV